jgi:hypothetical protein
MTRISIGAILVFVFLGGPASADGAAKPEIQFNRDIRPILSENCFLCHGPDHAKRKAGLRLDTPDGAAVELDAGRAIVPGKPLESLLVQRILAEPAKRMPPAKSGRHLTQHQIDLLREWIAQGAQYEKHWSFLPPRRPPLPKVKDKAWPKNPIDYLVLARLEKEGFKPSPEAPRQTLLRRVTLDLTGLPPTPAELAAFVADRSPAAYEKVVDRLLASPRYAERMTMHWLDLARYADTNGYNNDEERTMWPWRDWVIDAFLENMPYDQFLSEQLAGDLLEGATLSQKIATGFNRNHVITTEGGIFPEEYRVEYVADRIHTAATVFLGLSMQCARCHDHKYDPISQKDYYRFFAFFNNVEDQTIGYNGGAAARPYLKAPSKAERAELVQIELRRLELAKLLRDRQAAAAAPQAKWERELPAAMKSEAFAYLAEALAVAPDKRSPAQHDQVRDAFSETADEVYQRLQMDSGDLARRQLAIEKKAPLTMVMAEQETPRKTFVLKRGQYDQPGELVTAGVPGALPNLPPEVPANRLGLARWLATPRHPLTARVAVNRWWEMLFGAGIVETVEDFGAQGAWPSHPELLDWLATDFASSSARENQRKWDVKTLLKRIVTSATYRQSSRVTRELFEKDPKNRLLARGPRVRLPAETLRDQALAVSGLLKERLGGPSVMPYQPAGLWEEVSVERRAIYKQDTGDGLYRRSMYTYWKRTCPPPGMTAFDAPDREFCTIRRARTNTPLQALVMLNDATYLEAARKMAERLLQEGGATSEGRLRYAFRLAVCRDPRDAEQKLLLSLYEEAHARFGKELKAADKLLRVGASPRDRTLDAAELAAWTTVASAIMNLDEAITKE